MENTKEIKYTYNQLQTYAFSNYLIFIYKRKNKWNKFKEACKNNLLTLNLYFIFLHFFFPFNFYSFPCILPQIFQKSNIGISLSTKYTWISYTLWGHNEESYEKLLKLQQQHILERGMQNQNLSSTK